MLHWLVSFLSRNKQIVGERLFYSGMNVAYGDTSFPSNGPVPILSDVHRDSLRLVYDQAITYDQTEISGFYYCCDNFVDCSYSVRDSDWPEIESQYVKLHDKGFTMLIGRRKSVTFTAAQGFTLYKLHQCFIILLGVFCKENIWWNPVEHLFLWLKGFCISYV